MVDCKIEIKKFSDEQTNNLVLFLSLITETREMKQGYI